MAKKTTATTRPASTAVAPQATASTVTLAAIIEATKAGNFLYVPTEVSQNWLDAGLVECNTDMVNEAGVATRATEKGINSVTDQNTAPVAVVGASPFRIRSVARALVETAAKAASSGSKTYPLADLLAPSEMPEGEFSAFFIPATKERPDPWKSLASSISSAAAAFKKKTGEEQYEAVVTVYQKDEAGNDVKDAEGKRVPVKNEDGTPKTEKTTKTRNVYEFERVFKVTKGQDVEFDAEGNEVKNEDGTPKMIDGAFVSRIK